MLNTNGILFVKYILSRERNTKLKDYRFSINNRNIPKTLLPSEFCLNEQELTYIETLVFDR